jgi:MFS/sugar transport protein
MPLRFRSPSRFTFSGTRRTDANQSLFIYLVALLVTVRLLLSLYEIPSIALAPELTLDYDQRTGLMSSRFFFGTLGGAGMGVFALQVFLRKDATHPLGLMNRPGYSQRPGRRPLDVRVDYDFVSRHS